ncbi:hypothetical protein HUN08_14480 [Gordonia sp. X0973]|uniref:hypothetical protein n=1 Tax=Gordonia sp. X0973 TaxID=2742602 RepID=UPI000F51D388|nr:hypothetical protein [Gordonia sp. X0973]QKT08271.1 hypothetical protein HUN08_14480 [Gordonia sp. X0973]
MVAKTLISATAALGLAAGIVTAAPAHAQEVRHVARATCKSISPNVVDRPYGARITTTQWMPLESGRVTVYIAQSPSVFGYRTRPHLRWRNLDTGRTGQATTVAYSNQEGAGATFVTVPTGRGRVAMTAYTDSSNPAWSVRSSACSTIVNVR